MTDTLIRRLEAEESGSRALSMEVLANLPDNQWHGVAKHEHAGGEAYRAADLSRDMFVTQSIDAALTLVPEGCLVRLEFTESGARAVIHPRENETKAGATEQMPIHAKAATPALALCIAALRAMETETDR